MNDYTDLRKNLISDGYCHVRQITSSHLVNEMREKADKIAKDWLEGISAEERKQHRLRGTIIDVWKHPEMAPLIGLPAAIEALKLMGFPNPKFYSGYIISKPPEKAPALFWHQDDFKWNEPINYSEKPTQLFLMYYLIDTNRENGCLRGIPGSHRHRHRLHNIPLEEALVAEDGHPALQEDKDEVDVPVKAGDLVIGDDRLLHAAHPNKSKQPRTVLALWFCPTYDELPENIQAIYGTHSWQEKSQNEKDTDLDFIPENWANSEWRLIKPLLAFYSGNVKRASYNRVPDKKLMLPWSEYTYRT